MDMHSATLVYIYIYIYIYMGVSLLIAIYGLYIYPPHGIEKGITQLIIIFFTEMYTIWQIRYKNIAKPYEFLYVLYEFLFFLMKNGHSQLPRDCMALPSIACNWISIAYSSQAQRSPVQASLAQQSTA